MHCKNAPEPKARVMGLMLKIVVDSLFAAPWPREGALGTSANRNEGFYGWAILCFSFELDRFEPERGSPGVMFSLVAPSCSHYSWALLKTSLESGTRRKGRQDVIPSLLSPGAKWLQDRCSAGGV